MSTYSSRVRARNHVAAFIKANYKRNDMSMIELTPDFIKEFAVFLATDRGLQNGSIWANCMWLKGVVMRAHYNGLMPRNPFAQFHISPNVKERLPLRKTLFLYSGSYHWILPEPSPTECFSADAATANSMASWLDLPDSRA